MTYYSFSYWMPLRQWHFVGWVYASSYEGAFKILESEFAELHEMGKPIEWSGNRYHPEGLMYRRRPSIEGPHAAEYLKDLRKFWDAGVPPEDTYLFFSKDRFWVWCESSQIWAITDIEWRADIWKRHHPNGEVKLTYAYVIPPYMTLNAYRDRETSPERVWPQASESRPIALYPGHYRC